MPRLASMRTKWDHPRTRGEKVWLDFVAPLMAGSPPHTRGKAWPISRAGVAPGITPAHAGKSERLMSEGV